MFSNALDPDVEERGSDNREHGPSWRSVRWRVVCTYYTYWDQKEGNGYGKIKRVMGPDGIRTYYEYNMRGDPTQVVADEGVNIGPQTPDYLNLTTNYTYEPTKGRLISVDGPGGAAGKAVTNYEYDAFGRLTKVKDPLWTSGSLRTTELAYSAKWDVER